MIKGFRFTNQLANAEVDARIHQEFLNKNDGIFYGMELSYTNSSVTITEGLCEIAGRPIAVIDSETVAVSTENLYCLLVLEIDLSKESTKDTFNQVTFKILTSSADYPKVTQQDINKYGGSYTVYQLEFARFRTSFTGVSNFKDTRMFLDFDSIYLSIQKEYRAVLEQLKQELANVKAGSSYLLKEGGTISGDLKVEGYFEANNLKLDIGNSNSNIDEINKTEFRYTTDIERTPNGENGYLFTHKMDNDYLIQEFTSFDAIDKWIRAKTDASWKGWRKINISKILFNNSSGTTASIILPETCANFEYCEIFYGNSNIVMSQKVYSPNGKIVHCPFHYFTNNLVSTQFLPLIFSGTSVARGTSYYFDCNSQGTANDVKIFKIVGYR